MRHPTGSRVARFRPPEAGLAEALNIETPRLPTPTNANEKRGVELGFGATSEDCVILEAERTGVGVRHPGPAGEGRQAPPPAHDVAAASPARWDLNDAAPKNRRDSDEAPPHELCFDEDSAELTPALEAKLRDFIDHYQRAVGARPGVDIIGHTGSAGQDGHDVELARARAETVQRFLTARGLADVPTRNEVVPHGRAISPAAGDPRDQRVDVLVRDDRQVKDAPFSEDRERDDDRRAPLPIETRQGPTERARSLRERPLAAPALPADPRSEEEAALFRDDAPRPDEETLPSPAWGGDLENADGTAEVDDGSTAQESAPT